MANPNYDNIIIGSGIAGLTVFYYLTESTKTRNLLITNKLESQTTNEFPLGPRFLHQSKDTEAMLRRLNLSTKTREVFIGYKMGDEIRNYPSEEFKRLYALKSRGTDKQEGSFLSGGGKSSFTAYEVSQVQLAKKLLEKYKDFIIVDNIKSIDFKKISCDKNTYYSDNIVSTIPLNSLIKMLSNTSFIFKLSSEPKTIYFYWAENEKGKGQFDYIYSVTDAWHRKTYVPESNSWVYESKDLMREGDVPSVVKCKMINSQISRSLNLRELGNIKLVGRYAQMNHSIKTEDIIHWAHNYTRKFKSRDEKNRKN